MKWSGPDLGFENLERVDFAEKPARTPESGRPLYHIQCHFVNRQISQDFSNENIQTAQVEETDIFEAIRP